MSETRHDGSADHRALSEVLDSIYDLTLATINENGSPHATTVSYVNQGLVVYFGTSPASRKSQNITRDPRVSFTANRPYRFWNDIVAIIAEGRAFRVTDSAEFRRAGQLLYERFPEVSHYVPGEFDDVALYRIELEKAQLLDYSVAIGHSRRIVLNDRI